jgi:hypothetical protein
VGKGTNDGSPGLGQIYKSTVPINSASSPMTPALGPTMQATLQA